MKTLKIANKKTPINAAKKTPTTGMFATKIPNNPTITPATAKAIDNKMEIPKTLATLPRVSSLWVNDNASEKLMFPIPTAAYVKLNQ